ncbi:endonuclease MutS2 [Fructilactobacillus sanfranciscensis]|uniref:Endonuclease MutS2 n=1 Tax=Fructilactobacillus sanfranciscensis TaxID=1625 RepID=A0A5C4TLA9_FRUSA|nr:endonuclease MutS2 [Fructilactobacillus sanfranciscensis]MCG7195236.1 endonuclease MutS2 [Fructilactobacillus sanfranciscensis]MDN4461709.1 endonuclease MutS2 [Fructilactobacillus sanfranciscensis]MVF15567.1 endonuclease MutS2 [Fructilactobacillus sanfranciscensis]NDR61092.1 endonuclease MutS2 [Fructilactobacillus sanfranciscensis]NDR69222.1 endonuclease MutS2 [Fructilactobacillus sanfranciscensis]
MNQKVLDTLEYKQIKQKIGDYLATENGKKELKQLLPSSEAETVNGWLDETDDGAHIYRLNHTIPIPKLVDITPSIKRLEIGANLNGKELAQVSAVLNAILVINRFFENLETEKVELHVLYEEVKTFSNLPEITVQLKKSVDDSGKILDSASGTLSSIRRQISRLEGNIKSKMESFTHGKQSKYLSDPIITIRDDRYVIPVKAEYKQKIGGIVHDQSTSGQTIYLEPASVVGLNNDLRREQINEREEEKRILAQLSDLIRPYQMELLSNAKQLGHFDLINAKARYAASMKATRPEISADNQVNLKNARHPLINQEKVVGNDIKLGFDYRQIIITGPNTGGKTITMKTLGLLQLMAQSGLFITADEGSQAGLYDEVFADIGDDQSIEQNLSTFSSHIDNIISILKRMTNRSLVLIDELGAGTDPREGAALAMSILDAISQSDAEVLSTTHYPELKVYGYNRPETINASMEFDEKTLSPTYRLMIGIPGQSNALSIAGRLGLNESIIMEAESLVDEDSQDINSMIKKLTQQTKAADDRARKLEVELKKVTELHQELTEKFNQFTERRDAMINKAKRDANQIVSRTKRQANEIIDDLHKRQKNAAIDVKENELIEQKGKINALEQHTELKNNKVLKRSKAKKSFKVGDDVLVKTYGQRGVLLKKIGNHSWEVELGILKMKVDETDMDRVKEEKPKHRAQTVVHRTRSSSTSPTLDLRGVRYDDAMQRLDRYIDSALLAGYPSVTIIHGKGTGALRKGVINYLRGNRQVKEFGFSPANSGGDGSTVVKFK